MVMTSSYHRIDNMPVGSVWFRPQIVNTWHQVTGMKNDAATPSLSFSWGLPGIGEGEGGGGEGGEGRGGGGKQVTIS